MTPTGLSPRLLAFERSHDASKLTFNGVPVWPLARLALTSRLLWQPDSQTPATPELQQLRATKPTIKSSILNVVANGVTRANLARHAGKNLDALVFGWDVPKVESGTLPPFHRWLSAAYRDLQSFGYKVDWIGPGDDIKRPGRRPSGAVEIFLPNVSPFAVEKDVTGFEVLREVGQVLDLTDGQVRDIETEFLKLAGRVADLKQTFACMLDQLQPGSIYFYCWHSAQNLALSWAAYERNIPTIDIQHGKQGALNPHYTHWYLAAPSPLLPAHFWTWGHESARRINEENEPSDRLWHRSIMGGHRDLAAFQASAVHLSGPGAERLAAYRRNGRRIALVTLQPLKPAVPELVVEAMRAAPENVQWVVRGPLQKNVPWREQLAAQFARLPPSIDTETGNALPLFALLAHADVHVTAFSGTALEALDFGVPTVFTHPLSRDVYATQLAAGHAAFVTTVEELTEKVRSFKRVESQSGEPYCVTGDHIAEAAYKQCTRITRV